jgi:hypothetical protein
MTAGTDARHLHAFCVGEASEPGSKLREGIDRAEARDRRVATDWILRVLDDAVAESDAKAAKSGE